jgi:hypothetical protein
VSDDRPKYTIEDLIVCGERAVDEYSNPDHQLSAIEAYVAVFDRLFNQGQDIQIAKEQVDRVQAVHSKVLELAEALRGVVSSDLKGLMAKGKATLKYVDHLPKRISVSKPQLG